MNVALKRDSGHKVERSSGGQSPMAKETTWRLKKGATGLR